MSAPTIPRQRTSELLSRRHVVLSLGMGVDSVALLVRWIDHPSTRNFDLADLILVIALISSSMQI
jgi:hypothetical protein